MPAKKSKEKVFFTIPWTSKHKIAVTKPLLRRIGLITLGLFIFLTVGFGSNTLPFVYSTISCLRLPVQTSNFMGSHTLTMPGEKGYGPNLFNSYRFCTKEQAQAAGYGPTVLSEEAKQKLEAQQKAREEAERFSPSKVPYTVYSPVLEGYEASNFRLSTIQSNIHTFIRIKKNGTVIGELRELKSDDSYNICTEPDDPNESYCKVIGHDSQGREIKRSYRKGFKEWTSSYVGINIDGTGIILSSDDDTEAVNILSSLQKYTEN